MNRSAKPIICCGFTPCVQRMVEFEKVEKGGVNRAQKVTVGIGGKGANVARMITQLGAPAELLQFTGGANGALIESLLAEEGVSFRGVKTAGETRICQTLIEAGNPDTTELVEETPPVTPDEWRAVLDLLNDMDAEGAWVAISGKLPAGAPEDGYSEITRCVKTAGGSVLVDTQGAPLLASLKHRPDLVKINAAELEAATGRTELIPACRVLLEAGAGAVFITRGRDSSFYVDATRVLEVFPPEIDAVNPIGSGDAVTAGIVVASREGASIEDALVLGMACGAANALNLLCGYLKAEDVERLRDAVRLEVVGE